METFHARRGDPATSHMAAARLHLFSGKHAGAIYWELKRHGAGTYEELSKRTGLRADQVWRRLSDLQKRQLAEPTEEIRAGTSGRAQRVWRAV